MNKKTRSIFVLFALAAGTLVTLATSPASPVRAADPDTSALYQLTAVESETTPIGCTGCSPQKTNTPTFAAQTGIGTTVASATKIDTFNTQAWDQVAQSNITIEGGCAIVALGLKCWGKNMNGQLGDETTTNSLTTPVTGTESGVAITGVTDLSTNGLTTCIVAAGVLKCVGSGNLPGIYSKNYNYYGNIQTKTDGVYTNASISGTRQYVVYGAGDSVLYDTGVISQSTQVPQTLASKKWVTITGAGTDVKKVQVGNSNNGSTPNICVLKTTGLASCAVVTASTASTSTTTNTNTYNCKDAAGVAYGSGAPTFDTGVTEYESTTSCDSQPSFKRRENNQYINQTDAAVWTFADAEVTGAVDIAMPSDSWGAASICFAGATTICRTFSAGVFGAKKTIENGENSQAVYMTSGWGPPGLCLYSNDTISCGAGTSTQAGTAVTTKVTAVAVMAKPLNVFFGNTTNMQKLYFLLPTGILSADAWILTCSNCGSTSTNVVAPVTAFAASTATSYTYAKAVNGSTDSADYIPLTVSSGTRRTRSLVGLNVKTSAGELLKGVSVRWTAPDAPGTLSSSASSTLTTDDTGYARSTVTSGPVTFTLSVPTVTTCPPTCTNNQTPTTSTTSTTVAGETTTPAAKPGSLASGATLQAASITVIVGDSGDVIITVPDAPVIVQRKITVTMPDGTVVPNATVQLKNNYLSYAYQNSGTSTSTWSSRPKDTNGYLGQMNCAYCFVAPPKYATGVDGSVTFPSFNPLASSAAYDADVVYDDGDLSQTVKKDFVAITDTVQMPFMAGIKIALPAGSTDPNNVKPDANGAVTLTSTLKDGDGNPINKLTESVEVVTPGTSCDTGGLVASTAKVTDICKDGGVTAASVDLVSKASIVRAMSVRANAGCSAIMTTTSASNGQATLVLCPSASTKYRVRGTGAVGSQTICVQVNNAPCTVSASSANTGANTGSNNGTYTNTNTYTPTVVSKVAVMKKGKVTSFTTINKTAKVSFPPYAKVVLVVAVTTKKFCSVSGLSVKALLPGSCTISVKVTPKGSKKTTTTKIKITISK